MQRLALFPRRRCYHQRKEKPARTPRPEVPPSHEGFEPSRNKIPPWRIGRGNQRRASTEDTPYASLTMNLCASPISSKDSLLTCSSPTNPQIHHPSLCSISTTLEPYLVKAPCTNLLNRNHQDPGENHHRCRHSIPYL